MTNFQRIYNNFCNNIEKDFDNIVIFINNRDNITNYKNFIGYIFDDIEISLNNTKIFLSTYLLKYVPSQIINIENDESTNIINKSSNLLNLFDLLVQKYFSLNIFDDGLVNTFKLDFNSFMVDFKKWKKNDIDAFLYNAVAISYDLKLTLLYIDNKKSDNNQDIGDEYQLMETVINNQLKDIHMHVKSLKLNELFVQLYKEYLINQKASMMRQEIVDIGKNAYYDCIEHKINNGDFSMLELFIDEFREQLSKILPKNKEFNKDINFEESFDTVLIIQMIKNNAFDKEDFLKLFNYFFDLFMKLQPAKDDEELIEWKNNFMINFDDSEFIKNIISFLRYYMNKIETIQQKMIDFYNKLEEFNNVN